MAAIENVQISAWFSNIFGSVNKRRLTIDHSVWITKEALQRFIGNINKYCLQ